MITGECDYIDAEYADGEPFATFTFITDISVSEFKPSTPILLIIAIH